MKTALVLGGGGARGAYEVGVMAYLREELEPELGRPIEFQIYCGTSVGAIHACVFAATAEEPAGQTRVLAEHWRALRVDSVLPIRARDLVCFGRELLARPDPRRRPAQAGIVSAAGLSAGLLAEIPWDRIGKNLAAGRLEALSLGATHVRSGRPTVFVQSRPPLSPRPWPEGILARAAVIGQRHALASSAVPLLVPPVNVDGELYADGSLRLNLPLTPALQLGADRLVAISLAAERPRTRLTRAKGEVIEHAFTSAAFLAGKALNALLADRFDQDLQRLQRLNEIAEVGMRLYGADFPERMARELPSGHTVRPVRHVLMHPSQELGALAAEHARSPEFARRACGVAGRLVRSLAEREPLDGADLTSYLLFDGEFADHLIELGRADARRRRDDWAALWEPERRIRPLPRAQRSP